MKSGELGKVVRAYVGLFPSDWTKWKNDFVRRQGSWLQLVVFNASRFRDAYEPTCCFEFLNEPGEILGSHLVQGFRHKRHNVQRWVTLKEHALSLTSIFTDMVEQFRPSILAPLRLEEIKAMLKERPNYWPHVYALCVMAAEEGHPDEARHHFEMFCQMMADKPFDWAVERRQELDNVMALMNSPHELKLHLDTIEREKLAKAKIPI